MKRKLNCILLIDDDEGDNFLHEMVIKEVDCAETVISVQSAEAGLEYLRLRVNGNHPQPDLIALDINMPRMNGWEFLAEYQQLPENQRGRLVIVMLTNSLNPDDQDKAEANGLIGGFLRKPLTEESLRTILKENFRDYL